MIRTTTGADPFDWMRVILPSSGGTVMELGFTPIVTSGLVMQLLAGSKIIEVKNHVREDRALLNGAQKLLGILIVVCEVVAYVLSGMYGSVGQLGVGNAILIILQLIFVGIIVICLDELLQNGIQKTLESYQRCNYGSLDSSNPSKETKSPAEVVIDCDRRYPQPAFDHLELKGQNPLDLPGRYKMYKNLADIEIENYQLWSSSGEP